MPENGGIPGNGTGNSFSAGQYWAVVDSSSKVVDFGQLKYSGSFIIYGSDLISDGSYTLTVTDSEPELGDTLETSGENNSPEGEPNDLPENTLPGENGNKEPDSLSKNSLISNVITGNFFIGDLSFEYRYTDNVSYNGKKQKLSDFTVNGESAGSTLSGNIIFKKVRYKNNKAAGEGKATPVFKAATGADTSVKKAVKAINKEFKTDPLLFTISQCALDNSTLSGTVVYYKNTGKWRFNLKELNPDGTYTKLKYRTNDRGDFTVDSSSLNSENNTVTITGINNFTGTAVIPVTIK